MSAYRFRDRSHRGFSLVETLVVVGILALLLGILLPILAGAKQRAKVSQDLSALHQLGVAAAMYHDANERWALGTPPLVAAGLVPSSIVVSPSDAWTGGFANALVGVLETRTDAYKGIATPYRRSYVGLYDYAAPYKQFQALVEEQPGAGWLVSLTESRPTVTNGIEDSQESFLLGQAGTYRRLLLDGSVLRRVHITIDRDGKRFQSIFTAFAEGDAEWQQKIASL